MIYWIAIYIMGIPVTAGAMAMGDKRSNPFEDKPSIVIFCAAWPLLWAFTAMVYILFGPAMIYDWVHKHLRERAK